MITDTDEEEQLRRWIRETNKNDKRKLYDALQKELSSSGDFLDH